MALTSEENTFPPTLGAPNLSLNFEETSEATSEISCEAPPYLCIYDFDQTLTVVHAYNLVSSKKAQAATDHNNIEHMNDLQFIEKYVSDAEILTWFGDEKRREQLQKHLKFMKDANAECRVLTSNSADVVTKCLKVAGLYKYFKVVVGRENARLRDAKHKKSVLIGYWRRQTGLGYYEVIFVDDDKFQIRNANTDKVCMTVRVDVPRDGVGMNLVHMRSINRFVKKILDLKAQNIPPPDKYEENFSKCLDDRASE